MSTKESFQDVVRSTRVLCLFMTLWSLVIFCGAITEMGFYQRNFNQALAHLPNDVISGISPKLVPTESIHHGQILCLIYSPMFFCYMTAIVLFAIGTSVGTKRIRSQMKLITLLGFVFWILANLADGLASWSLLFPLAWLISITGLIASHRIKTYRLGP